MAFCFGTCSSDKLLTFAADDGREALFDLSSAGHGTLAGDGVLGVAPGLGSEAASAEPAPVRRRTQL